MTPHSDRYVKSWQKNQFKLHSKWSCACEVLFLNTAEGETCLKMLYKKLNLHFSKYNQILFDFFI